VARPDGRDREDPQTVRPASPAYVSLFWRVFVPNAVVLTAASVVLLVEPANGRVLVLALGLAALLAVNLVLMRRAFVPVARLARFMRAVDPLEPGERAPVDGPASEVTVLAVAFNGMLDRLEGERRDSARRALAERESERRRVAAELHDELGQTLTALGLELDRLARRIPDAHRPDALRARDAALAAVDDVRDLARSLRPEPLDALGLVPALTNLIERLVERTGLRIDRELDHHLPVLTDEEQLGIYRITQESLTNALRHADAHTVRVTLRADGARVALRVRDDGVGLGEAGPSGGTGVRAMRERAVLIGGRLRIGPPADGAGTEVRLELDAAEGAPPA